MPREFVWKRGKRWWSHKVLKVCVIRQQKTDADLYNVSSDMKGSLVLLFFSYCWLLVEHKFHHCFRSHLRNVSKYWWRNDFLVGGFKCAAVLWLTTGWKQKLSWSFLCSWCLLTLCGSLYSLSGQLEKFGKLFWNLESKKDKVFNHATSYGQE